MLKILLNFHLKKFISLVWKLKQTFISISNHDRSLKYVCILNSEPIIRSVNHPWHTSHSISQYIIKKNNESTQPIYDSTTRWPVTRHYPERNCGKIIRTLWLGWTIQSHSHKLLLWKPKYQFKFEIFTENSMGQNESWRTLYFDF